MNGKAPSSPQLIVSPSSKRKWQMKSRIHVCINTKEEQTVSLKYIYINNINSVYFWFNLSENITDLRILIWISLLTSAYNVFSPTFISVNLILFDICHLHTKCKTVEDIAKFNTRNINSEIVTNLVRVYEHNDMETRLWLPCFSAHVSIYHKACCYRE